MRESVGSAVILAEHPCENRSKVGQTKAPGITGPWRLMGGPVAQWIEHPPRSRTMKVQILPGSPTVGILETNPLCMQVQNQQSKMRKDLACAPPCLPDACATLNPSLCQMRKANS